MNRSRGAGRIWNGKFTPATRLSWTLSGLHTSMAGPTATILLAKDLTPAQVRLLGDTIHSISDIVCGDDFSVITTRPIGGDAEFAARPFVSSSGRIGDPLAFAYTESELNQIRDLMGVSPIVSLTFAAMCNDQIDHEILARLCCYTAKKLDGIVDLNGTIACDTDEQSGLYEIEYQNHLYQIVSRQICRSDFLASYISHHDFRMVK